MAGLATRTDGDRYTALCPPGYLSTPSCHARRKILALSTGIKRSTLELSRGANFVALLEPDDLEDFPPMESGGRN